MSSSKISIASAFLLSSATPALAEVCDKARPAWHPADGPVGQLGELLWHLSAPYLWPIIALVSLALFYPKWGSVMLALVGLAGVGGIILFSCFDSSPIAVAARSEGCVGAPWLTLFVLVSLSALVVIRGIMKGVSRVR